MMWLSSICALLFASLAAAAEDGLFTYPAQGGTYVWNTGKAQRIAWTSNEYGLYTITLGQRYKYVSYVAPIKQIFVNSSLTPGSWTWDWVVDNYSADLTTGNVFVLLANDGYAQNWTSEDFTIQRSVPGASTATTGMTYATLVSAANPNAATTAASNPGSNSASSSNSGSSTTSNNGGASTTTNSAAIGAGVGGGIGGAILLVGGVFAFLHHRRRRSRQSESEKASSEPLAPPRLRSRTPPHDYMMEQDFRDIPSELHPEGRYDPTKTPQEVHATHVVHEIGGGGGR